MSTKMPRMSRRTAMLTFVLISCVYVANGSRFAWTHGGKKLLQHHATEGTNGRSDGVSAALSAAQSAIEEAASAGAARGAATSAAAKNLNYARLANRERTDKNTEQLEFNGGRKLHQDATTSRSDRITHALAAAQSGIEEAVSAGAGRGSVQAAAAKNLNYAQLATRGSTHAWDFGHKRQ